MNETNTVETRIGTSVIETPRRVYNPTTEKHQRMESLSEDGYCRQFLAVLSAYNAPSVVDLDSSPVLTFDKDKWDMEERDGDYVVTKHESETHLDEMVLNNGRSADTEADQ